jgi:hypothetical protein
VPGLPWHVQLAADVGMDVRAGAADRDGVRMIGVDRRGYGLSKMPIAPAVGEAPGEGGTRRDLRLELAEVFRRR